MSPEPTRTRPLSDFIEDSTDLVKLQYQNARIMRNMERDLYIIGIELAFIGIAILIASAALKRGLTK